MKRIILVLLLVLSASGLFAEMLYNVGGDNNYLRLSFSYTKDNQEYYLIWAREQRELFTHNYNNFEITTHNEQKAYDLLLQLSECESYEELLNEYSKNNKSLVLIKKELKVSYEDEIFVNYYYELR